ncbi:MAG: hypothetical protein AAFR35_02190 [Pseudomonadota bacterium]
MIARALVLSLAVLGTASVSHAACNPDSPNAVDIYPTASELPENILRFYVYFPRPMAATAGLDDVRLLDAKGFPVNGVFLPNRDNLWSPDRQRLTLLLDPGRVKTGLSAHEAMGRALVVGQSYTLEVSGEILDASDCALGTDRQHSFSVIAADLSAPNPADWSLTTPRAETTEPVIVDLATAHDHLSLAYRLRVVDAASNIVPGSIALGPDETSWLFSPRTPWRAASYALLVDERLEDLAGNRPGRLFDQPASVAVTAWDSRRVFTPGSARD